MGSIRPPAVAGLFYPEDPGELRIALRRLLDSADDEGSAPKALIAPHAGYIYSGPVAASAYARLRPARDSIERVVLLGPAHHTGVPGLALPSSTAFATPLGEIPLDEEAMRSIADMPQVKVDGEAHANEHSLEVHLPFLQEVLSGFRLVPLLVGNASDEEGAEVLERLWGGPETLVVISSDLSHYRDYDSARGIDRATSRAIEELRLEDIHPDHACGCRSIRALLSLARRTGMHAETIDLRSSGDTAGPRDRVVGYGAYVLE